MLTSLQKAATVIFAIAVIVILLNFTPFQYVYYSSEISYGSVFRNDPDGLPIQEED